MRNQIAWSQPVRYYGEVVPVSWDAVLGLCSLGSTFLALLLDSSSNSSLLRSSVKNFLRFSAAPLYGVSVTIEGNAVAVEELVVSIFPQLRYYVGGCEVGRLYGGVSYEDIQQLLAKGVHFET